MRFTVTVCAVSLKEYKKIYENIRDMEKKLATARKQLVCCVHVWWIRGRPLIGSPLQSNLEEKEKKLAKELVKGPKDLQVAQEKLRQTKDCKQLAQAEGML